MSSPVKFKFRIRFMDDTNFPYYIEEKGLFFWKMRDRETSQSSAESKMHQLVRLKMMKPGTVLKEYTHEDYLADKLKGYD